MKFFKFISTITGYKKTEKTNKVQVELNYIQTHVESGSLFGQTMDTSEVEHQPTKSKVNT